MATHHDLIALLYLSVDEPGDSLSAFSKTNGFSIHSCSHPDQFAQAAADHPPDLILIETQGCDKKQILGIIKTLDSEPFPFKPALFLVTDRYPDMEERVLFFDGGVDDFLITPVQAKEVSHKYKVFGQNKLMAQDRLVRERELEKAREYLDEFKTDLKTTKETLFEERDTLNSTLKQVNRMVGERSRLKQEKKAYKDRLAALTDDFFRILERLIKNRVEHNKGHGERVAHIAHFIAKHFDFDQKKLEELRKAAMLHEVGLLLIPEVILNKADNTLSEYEKDLLDNYTVRGAEFFLECTEFKGCAQIIKGMNENSDGTGRPDGLKRQYIPLLSRILAGADVFDTLKDTEGINGLDDFLVKLEHYAGSRLDPNIVAWLEKYAVLHMGTDDYRVKGVGIHQLKPGMTLATALFTTTGTKLFSVNTLLTQDAIDKIGRYNKEYPVDETVYIRA